MPLFSGAFQGMPPGVPDRVQNETNGFRFHTWNFATKPELEHSEFLGEWERYAGEFDEIIRAEHQVGYMEISTAADDRTLTALHRLRHAVLH